MIGTWLDDMWLNDPDQLRPGRLYEWEKRTVQSWVPWFDEIDRGKNTHTQNAVDGPPNGSALVYMGKYREGRKITGYSFLVPNRGVLTVFNSDVVYGLREIS